MKETDAIAFLRPTPLTSVSDLEALHRVQTENFGYHYPHHHRHHRHYHHYEDEETEHVEPEPDYDPGTKDGRKAGRSCSGRRLIFTLTVCVVIILLLAIAIALGIILTASDDTGKDFFINNYFI